MIDIKTGEVRRCEKVASESIAVVRGRRKKVLECGALVSHFLYLDRRAQVRFF